MKKVLIIRLSALGDVIFTIPLANTLKDNGYEVSWLVSEKGYQLLKDNPEFYDVVYSATMGAVSDENEEAMNEQQ